MTFANRLLTVLGTSIVLLFFSEFFFANEGPVGTFAALLATNPPAAVLHFGETILWYALPTYLFLIAIGLFRARTVWAVFLAGSLFGYVVEGVIAYQMYEGLPLTISWTPLGWHVLADVLLGWLLVRRILQRDTYLLTAVMAVLLGASWGVWATWTAPGAPLTEPALFLPLIAFTGVMWILGTLLLDRWGGRSFVPARWEVGVVGGLTAVFFVLQVVTVFPLALVVFPAVMGLSLWLLWRNRQRETRPDILSTFTVRPRWANYLLLLLMPLTAAAVYTAVYEAGLVLPLADLVVPLLMLAGFVLYGVAAVRQFWPPRAETQESLETAEA